MILDKTRRKVYFNKATAIAWIIAGVLAFYFGWIYAIVFTAIASIYANVKADWSTAEAADDRAVTERLDRIEKQNHRMIELMEAVLDGNRCAHSCCSGSGVLRS